MKLMDLQQEREKQELEAMTRDLGGVSIHTGPVSEPTTPPEYGERGFPSILSRPNRFSISGGGLTSPPGIAVRANRSGSQLTSPNTMDSNKANAKSVPASRRGSDGDDEDEFVESIPNHRSAAA